MNRIIYRSSRLAPLVLVLALSACVTPPQGPRVAIMPTPGKPLDLFSAEDQYCRGYAQQSVGRDTSNEAAVGSAVVGTLLGAAVGSAMSGRRDHTASGAATGLIMGSMIGAGNSAADGRGAQQRYDIAYEQCMVSKNNLPSGRYSRQVAPSAYPYPPPPPPSSASSRTYLPPPPPLPPQ